MNFGLLNVMVDGFGGLDSKNLTVGRASMNVLGESETGIIVTNGDPVSEESNSLVGYDFNYKNSNFNGSGNTVEGNFYVMKTFTSALAGDDYTYGVSLDYPNSEWEWGVKAEQVEENFNPALGFISETGIRQFEGDLERAWYPGGWGSIYLWASAERLTRIDGELITQSLNLPGFGIESPIGDVLGLGSVLLEEQLFEPWEIVDGVVIPAGNYRFPRFEAHPCWLYHACNLHV